MGEQSFGVNKLHLKLYASKNVYFVAPNEEYGEYQSVVQFLDLIPQDTLAAASFRSKAYTRAVMHFESFIMEKKQNIQEHLGFLQVRLFVIT